MISKTIHKAFKCIRLGYYRFLDFFSCYSKEDCRNAFVSYMNQKAKEIGAKTAVFGDPSGYWSKASRASALDLLHVFIYAAGIESITDIWSKKDYRMFVQGICDRMVSIRTTVNYDIYDNLAFPILGVKTGTEPNVTYNLAWLAQMPDGRQVACVLLGAPDDNSRWQDAMLVLRSIQEDDKVLLSEVKATSVAACCLSDKPHISDDVNLKLLREKNPDMLGVPASLTKIMSLICAIDYVHNLDEKVRIVNSDIVNGSGNNLKEGDVVAVRDLFYDMLLPSSNTAATALSRFIGKRILNSK